MINLFLLLAACTVASDSATVYYGIGGKETLNVAKHELGEPLDIAYDEAKRSVYVYSTFVDGGHILRWNTAGQLTGNWKLKLPDSAETPSAICREGGHVAIRAWNGETSKRCYFELPEDGSGPLTIAAAGNYYSQERSKSPTVKRVRTVMHNLGWYPFAHEGIHVGLPESLIDSFVATEPYRDERIEWTADFSVLCFSWQNGRNFHLAQRSSDGKYDDRDISSRILEALDWQTGPDRQIYLYSIILSRTSAIYGIQSTEQGAEPSVVWVDIRSPRWRVTRTEPGYLARELRDAYQ